MHKPFNPAMLQIAREIRLSTHGELFTLSGIPRSHIVKIEAGTVIPNGYTVARLAQVLDFPAVFMYREGEQHAALCLHEADDA